MPRVNPPQMNPPRVNPIVQQDLQHILKYTDHLWKELDGSRIFMTGGTGFFGIWLLEVMNFAQKQLGIQFQVTLLTRNPERLFQECPQFRTYEFIHIHPGDILGCEFPKVDFSHVIHGATTSARETYCNEPALKKFNTIAEGTRRVLEFTEQRKIQNFWLMSSGSVYGKQPESISHISEEDANAPDPLDIHSALGQGKRVAEYLATVYAHQCQFQMKIARCFTFLGPYLPLDIHYAVGNFIRDALQGNPIQVKGTGLPVRSYLYSADLVIWLLTVFISGKNCRAYNVGSERSLSIGELAQMVSQCASHHLPPVPLAGIQQTQVQLPQKPTQAPKTAASDLYVPSTARARSELGLQERISLEEGIRRTLAFYLS